MTLDALIMLAGALVAIVPLMEGLPDAWQRVILVLLGVFVIALGIVVRRRSYGRVAEKPAEAFHTAPQTSPVIEARQESAFYVSQIPEVADFSEISENAEPAETALQPETQPQPEPEPEPVIPEPMPIMPSPAPAAAVPKKRASVKRTTKPRARRTTTKKAKVTESFAAAAPENTYEYSSSHEEGI